MEPTEASFKYKPGEEVNHREHGLVVVVRIDTDEETDYNYFVYCPRNNNHYWAREEDLCYFTELVFKVGDRVRVMHSGRIGTITEVDGSHVPYYVPIEGQSGGFWWYKEDQIERVEAPDTQAVEAEEEPQFQMTPRYMGNDLKLLIDVDGDVEIEAQPHGGTSYLNKEQANTLLDYLKACKDMGLI